MPEQNDLTLITSTVTELRTMVEDSVNFQMEVAPVYHKIAQRVLAIFDKEEELEQWSGKDLIKLLELTNKAQLQPVEQLTKLVQSITALYERSELQDKMHDLEVVVNELKSKKEEAEINDENYDNIEEVEKA